MFGFTAIIYAEDEIIPEPEPNVTFIVRNGDSIIYQGMVALPGEGSDRSVLAILKTIDESSDTFFISNIQNFSFGAYLKCILPNGGVELCDNWQYAVGSFSPFSSIDTTTLAGGETVGIYFGNSHQLVLNTNTIAPGSSLKATAEKYDYENNTWNPLAGVSVGVTLPNPDDQWNPIIISTHSVDALGNANITIMDVNTYTLGIVEDFYFPSYTITVAATASSGGGNAGEKYIPPIFNVQNAMTYLKSMQNTDGSFGDSDLYTDWVAIAFGALDVTGNSKDNLLAYLNSHNSISSFVTDNERRVMALLALGQNPYSFNDINYIDAITNSFDGTQFGDTNLINDDIFALIPLKSAGYDQADEIITKDVSFLISKQKINGSWEESVDITAAAIQALKPFETINGVSDALLKSTDYLVNTQGNDGGWDNVSSTSWAMQAMNTLGTSWKKNDHTANSYLGLQQTEDGAVLLLSETSQDRIWATSYAIPAELGKSWNAIMQSVPKPIIQNNSNIIELNEEIIPIVVNTSIISEDTNKKSKEESKEKIPDISQIQRPIISPIPPTNIDTTPKIIPNTLTATVVNTPPTQTILVALGILSVIVLVYFLGKFFII